MVYTQIQGKRDDGKAMFLLYENELNLLRAAYNTWSYLLNKYENTVYKQSTYS